jgi:hypothetical protein
MLNVFLILVGLIVVIGVLSSPKTFARYVALSFDMFFNVLTAGMLDVTISSRAGIAAAQGKTWGKILSKFLDIFEKNHCQLAIQSDIDHAQQVIQKLSPYDTRNK